MYPRHEATIHLDCREYNYFFILIFFIFWFSLGGPFCKSLTLSKIGVLNKVIIIH